MTSALALKYVQAIILPYHYYCYFLNFNCRHKSQKHLAYQLVMWCVGPKEWVSQPRKYVSPYRVSNDLREQRFSDLATLHGKNNN